MAIGKLKIGDKIARLPIIQGGMGVGVSRSSLAGAVAAAGGVGIISTAQIGYDEEGFEQDPAGCNLRAIRTFADSLRNVKKIEVLPYHDMARFKYEKLGIPYTIADVPCPTKEQVAHAEAILCKDLTQN